MYIKSVNDRQLNNKHPYRRFSDVKKPVNRVTINVSAIHRFDNTCVLLVEILKRKTACMIDKFVDNVILKSVLFSIDSFSR